MLAIFFTILAYLSGSVNFAIIICRLAGLGDPRKEGSHNPGATNVLRLGGKKLAFFVIAGDALKGVVPILIARACDVEGLALSIVAVAAVLGHLYPIFFQFRGGKGVATLFGAIIALSWLAGLLVIISWLVVAVTTRYSSLASVLSIILLPLYLIVLNQTDYVPPMLLLALLIIYRHHGNIKRLIRHEEPKIGKKK